jgi:hypothetical protein
MVICMKCRPGGRVRCRVDAIGPSAGFPWFE